MIQCCILARANEKLVFNLPNVSNLGKAKVIFEHNSNLRIFFPFMVLGESSCFQFIHIPCRCTAIFHFLRYSFALSIFYFYLCAK